MMIIFNIIFLSCNPDNKVAEPSFTPQPGTYSTTQNVTLGTSTDGATIYYTIDGSMPSTSSNEYTTPIEIISSTTIKAYAIKEGMKDSDIVSGEFIIQDGATVETPIFGHPKPQITISCNTSGATIYYTDDGTDPTTSSNEYTSPLTLSSSSTPAVKAFAVKSGLNDSSIATYNCASCH